MAAVTVPVDLQLHTLIAFAQRVPVADPERLETGWLVTRVQSGDVGAFNDLYLLYHVRLARYLQASLANSDRADDAVQEIFLRALQAITRFDPGVGHFGRWIFGIARNYLIDLGRREGRFVAAGLPELARANADESLHHDVHEDPTLRCAPFTAEFESLPLPQRQALFLRYVVDLPWADIAQILGRSPGAVRMLHQRAQDALRDATTRSCVDAA